MQIAILGAGAMGSFFGGKLAEARNDVTLLDVNEAHISAITKDGLRLQSDGTDRFIKNIHAATPNATSRTFELLIVFTKTMHTEQALVGARHVIGAETVVLTLQNGLCNVEIISKLVPMDRILVGVTTWPADFVGPGHAKSSGSGDVALASVSDSPEMQPKVATIARVLTAAGLACKVDSQVWAAIWEKVAFNAALNSICAVARCPVGDLQSHKDGKELALSIANEVIEVARSAGIPADHQRTEAKVLYAIQNHGDHKPSMLQDVLAGRPTEIESINGAVVAKAAELGMSVPYTETLLKLLRLTTFR